MGARGPTKKPAELEELHGNPGHRKTENRLQFSKPEKVPSPPVFLNKIAKRLAPIVFNAGMLTDADVGTFAAYCDSYAQWVLAEKAIQAKQPDKNSPAPLTFITAKGYEQQIPEISISNTAPRHSELKLTPSSRAGMTNPVETEDKKASIMEFISKKNRSA